MTVLIAVPVYRIGCKAGIDKGRMWSVIDELLLWTIARQPKSVTQLSSEANLPRQIVLASISRLMRFRLVEVVVGDGLVSFQASEFGFQSVSSGAPLPYFPKRISRRVSFVIECASGDFFPTREVQLKNSQQLDQIRNDGGDVRVIQVKDGGPSMSHADNIDRLTNIATRGLDEQIATIDGKTAIIRDNEYIVFKAIGGAPQNVPESAGVALRALISEAAALPSGTAPIQVSYSGPENDLDECAKEHFCEFSADDLIIGGSAQKRCFEDLISQAHRRVIIHSTFLDASRFQNLLEPILRACSRGVMFDVLWGAEKDDETEHRNSRAALKINEIIQAHPNLRTRFRMRLQSTGSHAKLMMLDTADGDWIAVVGSCNWLSSPFQSVELSVIIRNQHAVADIAFALQRLTGRRGLADDLATEMYLTGRDLLRLQPQEGSARLKIVTGQMHDQLVRHASTAAQNKFVVGSNRLGSTARPGAIMQGEVASRRSGVDSVVLYTQTSGPLKNRHARVLAAEAQTNGMRLVKTRKIPLHGKFIAWDCDDLVVTSLNWASAASDPDFPLGEIGVHINAPKIADAAMERLLEIFPELKEEGSRAT